MAVRSEAFFLSIDNQSKNKSAEQFDRLAGTLGFPPDANKSDFPVVVDLKAAEVYYEIEPQLNNLLSKQLGRENQPIPPIPQRLKTYLSEARPQLSLIQSHLLTQTQPQWETNTALMVSSDYPSAGLTNIYNTQKLLLLSAIAHAANNQEKEAIDALEASWQLNQAIAHRPDLTSKILQSTIADYQNRLLRHLSLPHLSLARWQHRLASQNQHAITEGIRFDAWLQYETLQRSLSTLTASLDYLASLSPVHHFKLTNIDVAQTTHRAVDRLTSANICEISPIALEAELTKVETANWNDKGIPTPSTLVKRWKTEGDRTLSQELTNHTLALKKHYQTYQQWPTATKTSSIECPEEYWLYKPESDGSISIEFSAKLEDNKLETSAIYPLRMSLAAPMRNR